MNDDVEVDYNGLDWRWVEARPVKVRSVRFNGVYEDLPPDARASGFLHVDDLDRVIVRTPNGPSPLWNGWNLMWGTAGEYYPIPPAIHDYKYWPTVGDDT